MSTKIQVKDLIKISPEKIAQYLSSKGWTIAGNLNQIANVWHPEKGDDHEILQPLKTELKDYFNRINDLLETLSDYENKDVLEILKTIQQFDADVVRIRVIHEDVENGSIPLNDGILLFEKAKDLVTSAVKSTFSKKKYFSGGKLPEETSEFLNSMRLGQTEHGSYVVNLIAPIVLQDNEQTDFDKVSITRAVTDNLANSLSAIDYSIEKYIETSKESCFDSAVEKGASANMCDALIGLSGEAKNRSININISLSGIEKSRKEITLEHTFDNSKIPYLERASEYYKDNYVIYNKTVSGQVTKLSYEEGSDTGVIVIEAFVNDKDKNVSIELPTTDYWDAHSAHKKKLIVECVGDLHVTSRAAKLLNSSGFKVLGDEDLFDE